jgi:hypothetical protein
MLRRRRPPEDPLSHVDPAAAPPRLAGVVAGALESRRRYHDMVSGLRPGAVRDRLVATGERVDAGVAAVWAAAQRAAELERLLDTLGPERVTAEYKRVKRAGGEPALEAALAQSFGSVQRLLNSLDDTEERLRLLDARLSAAVARAAEVALGGGTGAEEVGAELDGVVSELTALRTALDEVG